jgi:hypothetical protein
MNFENDSELLLDALQVVLSEIDVDFYDLCMFASAVGSNKALMPEDSKKLFEFARSFHGLARLKNRGL